MTQEEKELLTKVLCEQLPYGVIVYGNYRYDDGEKIVDDEKVEVLDISKLDWFFNGIEIKPYLRPLSSITEDEMEELKKLQSGLLWRKDVLRDIVLELWYSTDAFDFLNAKHFDIRGLIPMGLAIAAVGDDNPYKEKGGDQC